MTDATTGQVSAAAAWEYERFFVPALFGQWPPQLLRLAAVAPGQSVLDVGCGTGVLARAADEAVGPGGRVEGLDVNPDMLAVARAQAPDLHWTQAAAEDLPLATASQDRVLSQFALMFFTDQAMAVDEMARVLRPGGRICVATWAGLDASPGYAAMVTLVHGLFGAEPADALRAPFSVGSAGQLRGIMASAFPHATVRTVAGMARFASLEDWVRTDIRAWTLREMIDDEQFDALRTAAAQALAPFCLSDGRVAFPAPALLAHALR